MRFDLFMNELSRCASNADPRYDCMYASAYAIRDLLRSRALHEDEMVS